MADLDDALDSLTAREAAALVVKLQKRLQVCIIDGTDGAIAVTITAKSPATGHSIRATMMMCLGCIERHRLSAILARAAAEPDPDDA